jgi:hypothetical protein
MSATKSVQESGVLNHAKECAEDMGINLAVYVENHYHTTLESLADWQRVKLAADLHLFRKCKAFSDESQHYHPCEDCNTMVHCEESGCDDFSYGICRGCLEGEPY